VPESTCAVICRDGQDYIRPFMPRKTDPPVVLQDRTADVLIVEPVSGK
jgi:hypothetical protein